MIIRGEASPVPSLNGDPGYHLWQRDFTGASSLFGVLLHTESEEAVARMVDNYRYYKIGASWGGFESLVIPADPTACRTAVPWKASGYLLRYHIGLEDSEDLISDLTEGFQRLHSTQNRDVQGKGHNTLKKPFR